jgi:hypothetical protein
LSSIFVVIERPDGESIGLKLIEIKDPPPTLA